MRRLSLDFGWSSARPRRGETAMVYHLDKPGEVIEIPHPSSIVPFLEQYRSFLLTTAYVVPDISLFTSDTDTQEKAMKQITGVYTAPAQHCVGDGFPFVRCFLIRRTASS